MSLNVVCCRDRSSVWEGVGWGTEMISDPKVQILLPQIFSKWLLQIKWYKDFDNRIISLSIFIGSLAWFLLCMDHDLWFYFSTNFKTAGNFCYNINGNHINYSYTLIFLTSELVCHCHHKSFVFLFTVSRIRKEQTSVRLENRLWEKLWNW
jgi:hypothetical protein